VEIPVSASSFQNVGAATEQGAFAAQARSFGTSWRCVYGSASMGFVADSPDFVGRLRACRIAANLSQEELAAQSGVSIRAIGNLERGQTRWPHPGSVHRLADALKLTGPDRVEFVNVARRRLPGTTPGKPRPADGSRVVPRQLPPAVPTFAGRSRELAILWRTTPTSAWACPRPRTSATCSTRDIPGGNSPR
jgi:transcriptional regulator with XRE-family HTH domain